MDNDILSLWSPWLRTANSPWEQVLHFAVKKHYSKNDIILGNRQLINELYYLHVGEIKMIHLNSEGEEKPVWYIGSGNIFGETPFLLGGECNTIFTCVRDSIVYTFNRQLVMETTKTICHYPLTIPSLRQKYYLRSG